MTDDQFEYEPSTVDVIRIAVVEGWREGGWYERLSIAMFVFAVVAMVVLWVLTVVGLALGW